MKLTLADTTSGYNLAPINNNFDLIELEFQNKVLYRDNPTGEPNQMENDIDMNSNNLLNTGSIAAQSVTIQGKTVNPETSTSIEDFEVTTETGTEDLVDALNKRAVKTEIVRQLDDMTSFQNVAAADLVDGYQFKTARYHPSITLGGGDWLFLASSAKSLHDGIRYVSPTSTWDGSIADLPDFQNKVNETDPGGSGVFVRLTEQLSPYDAGMIDDDGTDWTFAFDNVAAVGLPIVGTGTFGVANFTPPANTTIKGVPGKPLIFKLLADGKLVTFQNNDITMHHVDFDCDSIVLSTPFPVQIMPNTERPELFDVEFRNYFGGTTGSEIQNCYGLVCDLDGVKDFDFNKLRFKNISNLGDAVATFNGFTGGLWFFNTVGGAIADTDVSRGVVNGVVCDTIHTRYPAGTSTADKKLDNDADAIRVFSATNLDNVAITFTNLYCVAVGKRLVKISNVSGMQFKGLYCDGSQPVDTDVPMESIIKDSGHGGNQIELVRGYFGTHQCGDAIQTQGVGGTTIHDVLVDNAAMIVGESGASKNLTITSIRAIVHGGIRLDNDASVSNSTVFVDDAHLIYDRMGADSASSNQRGATIRNHDIVKIGKLTIRDGQFAAVLVNDFSYDSINVEWASTVDPTTTGMGETPIFDMNVTSAKPGKLTLNTPDALAQYITTEGTAVARFRAIDSCEGGNTIVRSLNNNAVAIIRGTDGNYGDFTVFTDKNFVIGQQDADPVTNTQIGKISLQSPGGIIRWVRTVSNVVIGRVYKPNNNAGLSLFTSSTPTLNNNFVERVFWDANGGATNEPAGVTVIDIRALI